jgi:hypothetical protein
VNLTRALHGFYLILTVTGAAVQAPVLADSVPINTPINQLRKGEFLCMGEAMSTSRRGHATSTEVFTVLQKQKEHRSTIYDGAPMPYRERVAHPGYLAPVKCVGGQPIEPRPFAPSEEERGQLEMSPSGPVSIVLSQARMTVVSDAPILNYALGLTESPSTFPDPYVPDGEKYSWLRIGVPGHM